LEGYSGIYDLNQGYFICWDQQQDTTGQNKLVDLMLDSDFIDIKSTRSLIISLTVFNLPTQYYTNLNALFEITSTGLVNSQSTKVNSFTTPLQQRSKKLIFYLVVRTLMVVVFLLVIA
jgi:hypothetical protein